MALPVIPGRSTQGVTRGVELLACVASGSMTDRSPTKVAELIARKRGRASGVELVRSGVNHVFVVDDLVIRLAPPSADIDREAKTAKLLAGKGIAIPTLVDWGIADGQPFTAWERVQADSADVDFNRLGQEIGRLHGLDPSAVADELQLPWCDEASWLDLDAGLDAAEAANVVPDGDIDILRACWEQLRSWGDRCRSAGSPVICHGDVHPQNVIMQQGRAIVVDWDTICLGPPQWDHVALLTWSDRWGGQPRAYSDFAAGYGASFSGDRLASDLARLRLLAPTIHLIARGATSARHAAEAQLRIRYLARRSDRPRLDAPVAAAAQTGISSHPQHPVSMLLWFVKDQFWCVSEVLAGQGWATPVGRAGSY